MLSGEDGGPVMKVLVQPGGVEGDNEDARAFVMTVLLFGLTT